MTTADRLRELVEPILADLGDELFDLEFSASQLRITVDRPGGIDMEAVAAATRAISRRLDEVDPIPGKYTLEVSSPGLERSLRTPEHFGWAVGKQVAVKTVATYEGERRITGTLRDANDRGVVVSSDGGDHEVAYHDIDKARTVFEWGGQPKPTGNTRSGSSKKNQTRTKRAKAS